MFVQRFFKFFSKALSSKPAAQAAQPQKQAEKIHLKDVKIAKTFEPVRSERAEHIYKSRLSSQQPLHVFHDAPDASGKKSLAWVLWALKTAGSEYTDGISVHDVSALVYRAAQVELYPINVSRVVHNHTKYIRQVSQEKKTKRYLLTEEGQKELAKLSVR